MELCHAAIRFDLGEDPDFIDFSAQGAPPKMDARKVMEGLNGSRTG
jgi:hypothetical protein